MNSGEVLSQLMVTNALPSSGFTYVTNLTRITLPNGAVLTNAAAEPVQIIGGTSLVWNFTAVVSPSTLTNILISEVYYNALGAPEPSHEWVELYNPATNTISITNWALRDAAPGKVDQLPAMTLAPGEFVIVAANTNLFLADFPAYSGQLFQIADGLIGSELNNISDGIFLLNSVSNVVDGMSYGGSTAAFSPACPAVVAGHSQARDPANEDHNNRGDWADQTTPDPGSGIVPTGLQPGGTISLIYFLDVACGTPAGQINSRATYQQPPGAPGSSLGSGFISINPGDIIVSVSPLSQSAGVGDVVTWTLGVYNSGFGDVRNVVVSNLLGPGLVYQGFGIAPAATNSTASGTVALWNSGVWPALASIGPDQEVSVVITARVTACSGLFNQLDAIWGCSPTNICEDTSVNGNRITAGILAIDRNPHLTGHLLPAGTIPVQYCDGTNITIVVTNQVTGIDDGPAYGIVFSNTLPAGWSASGAAVDPNGHIMLGDLAPGAGTSVTFRITPGGACPIKSTAQPIYFLPTYTDPCGHPFGPPLLYTMAQVVYQPGASVIKTAPAVFSSDATSYPVRIYLAYSNFIGTEDLVIRDHFTISTNMYPTNFSGTGALVGTNVVWSNLNLIGSGVYTARFDMVIRTACGGPFGANFNRVTVDDYVDCQGCTRSVAGNGEQIMTYIQRGAGCPLDGGTGSCSYASYKPAPTGVVEVCTPVQLIQIFTNFNGSLPDWTGMQFVSDLGSAYFGALVSTTTVRVLVNNSNLTSYATIADNGTNLVIGLTGFNSSVYSNLTIVTNLEFRWEVEVLEPGPVIETSSLTVPACGQYGIPVSWNVGASRMAIGLDTFILKEACGIVTGRIELAHLPAPGLQSGTNALFDAYDVSVMLDLDADGNGTTVFEYIPGSTVFSNMILTGGTPTNGFDPVITSTNLTWNIGDLATNGAGVILYKLRATCQQPVNEQQMATVLFNRKCEDGSPPGQQAGSLTNDVAALHVEANLVVDIQPEVTYLTSTSYVIRLDVLNSGAGTAYNLLPQMFIPSNIFYSGSSISTTNISATNVIWDLQTTTSFGDLKDGDDDGFMDDLPPNGKLEIVVTNYIKACTAQLVQFKAGHGCLGATCSESTIQQATFHGGAGSMVLRNIFPANARLCADFTNVLISVRNSGVTPLYNVTIQQLFPVGVYYITNSSRYGYGGSTNIVGDPTGINPVIWTSAIVPPLAELMPGEVVTILFDAVIGCVASTGDKRFGVRSSYVDVCGTTNTTAYSFSVLTVDQPVLTLGKTASRDVADLNSTNVYTLTIAHDGVLSHADAPYMELRDTLPPSFVYQGASVPPSSTNGGVLVWSNSVLMTLAGNGLSPFALTEGPITITITGVVNDCVTLVNNAQVLYGCDATSACMTASASHTTRATPAVGLDLQGTLTLYPWGGTRTVTMTNTGSTALGMVLTNYAPTGYVFSAASITGEFNAVSLNMTLAGSPVGSIAVVDLRTAASSGAFDVDDDALNGPTSLDLGYRNGFTITFDLISDGSQLDKTADPTDLDFADPDPNLLSYRSSSTHLVFSNLCGVVASGGSTNSTIPSAPDPDIDIQQNSVIVSNNQLVTFTVTIVNGAEAGLASNLYARIQFGTGWTNLQCISTQIVQSGIGTILMDIVGGTNVLINMPGVILDPLDDLVRFTFTAIAIEGQGGYGALAEIAADSNNTNIPAVVATNVFGRAPLADTMIGSTLGPVTNARYYGFDQDQTYGAGYTISKTVRYQSEPPPGGDFRTARIGEPLIYRIEAHFFGAAFSNIVVVDQFPTNFLSIGTPVDAGSTPNINGLWTYSAPTGFTLPSPLVTTGIFLVDIPVLVTNIYTNQSGVGITNAADAVFMVNGLTNDPPPDIAALLLLEPEVQISKFASTNNVQAGDLILFSNIIVNAGSTYTTAYDVVFSDTLVTGLVFEVADMTTDDLDNDGDGVVNEPDEAFIVAGTTITVSSNNNAMLAALPIDSNVVVRFRARVMNQLIGANLVNTGRVTYTSMPGPNGFERYGSEPIDATNDYFDDSAITVSVQNVRALVKTLVDSTQTNTTNSVFTIGERVRYNIRVDIPQGIAANVVLTDFVPRGMDFVGSNSASGLMYPGFGYSFDIPAGGPQVPTNRGLGLTVTDFDPTPTSSVTPDGSGSNIVFSFSVITNVPDGSSANDYFNMALEFVILDTNFNDGILPGLTSASNVVRVQDAFSTLQATGPVYTINEPALKILKRFDQTRYDAGDIAAITIVVSNTAAGTANAYDIQVADYFTNTVFLTNSLTVLEVPTGWYYSNTYAATGLVFTLFSSNDVALAPNTMVSSRVSVVVAQSVFPNRIYTNRATLVTAGTIYGITPTNIVERFSTVSTSATFQVTNIVVTKVFTNSSETISPPDSTGTNVQIGEVVTYAITVTLPEGTLTDLAVVDRLPYGVAYIAGSASVDTSSFAGFLPALTVTPAFGGLYSPAGAVITNTFTGTTIVTNDNLLTNNSFILNLSVLVLSNGFNIGTGATQSVFTNVVTVTNLGARLIAVTGAVARVIEPVLTFRKDIVQTTADAGDIVDIVFSVSNSGTASAYDMQIRDGLDPVYFNIASVSNIGFPTGYWFSVDTTNLYIKSDVTNSPTGTNTIEVNESLIFTVRVTMAQSMPPNGLVTNLATLTFDSLRNTNIFAIQRLYASNSTDSITGLSMGIAKVFTNSSEIITPPDSSGTNVQIGEVVTYAITVTLPEGTVTNLQIIDTVPPGQAYIYGSARVAISNNFNGSFGVLQATPTSALPYARSGQVITNTFTGATVVTDDNLATNNTFVLYLDTVVLDTNFNNGLGPQTVVSNVASITFPGNRAAPVPVTGGVTRIVEPLLHFTKNIVQTTADAGDIVDIVFSVSNSGTASAYDVQIKDGLDPVYFNIASVSNIGFPTGYWFSVDTTNLYIKSDVTNSPTGTNTIEINESLVFTVRVAMAQSMPPNGLITNTAALTYDSLRSTNIYAIQRARTTNAYDSIIGTNMSLSKSLLATSANGPADSSGTNVQVGEVVTYRLDASLPEGTISNLVVTDFIPSGMAYVIGSLAVDTTFFAGQLTATTNITPSAGLLGSNGQDVVVQFSGNTVVSDDNNAANNILRFTLNAVALNTNGVSGLIPATMLTNQAQITFAGNPQPAVSSLVSVVKVIEPDLVISKQMYGPSNGMVTFELVVTNRGFATAYDVAIVDTVRTFQVQTATLAPAFVPAGFQLEFSGAPGDAAVLIVSDNAALPPTNSIEVAESLIFRFTALLATNPVQVITNIASIATNTTISGPDVYERREPPVRTTNTLTLPRFAMSKDRLSPAARPAAIGEQVSFRIAVTNTGLIGFGTVRVTDVYDTNYLGFASSVPPATSNLTGLLVWTNIGFLAQGASTSLTVNFTALASTLPGDTTNSATVGVIGTNGVWLPDLTDDAVVTNVRPEYTLRKTLLSPVGRPADVGEYVRYQLSVSNSGDIALYTVRLDDTYQTNYLLYSSSSHAPDVNLPGTLTWSNIGSVAVGGMSVVTATFTAVHSTLPGDTTNSVVSTVVGTNGVPVPPQTSAVPVQVAQPSYVLDKTLLSPLGNPADLSETVRYQLSVSNNGEVVLYPVRLDDVYDTNYLTFTSASVAPDVNVPGSLTWSNLGPVGVGGVLVVTAEFAGVQSTLPGDTTNTVGSIVMTTNGLPLPPQTSAAPVQIWQPASVGDFVWNDLDHDGIQDAGEPGISNVTVRLYGATSNLLDTIVTSTNGYYSFTNLVPGSFFIEFVPPLEYLLTLQNQGGDDAIDSDADPITRQTAMFALGNGQVDLTFDAGFYTTASIRGSVFEDLNGNGLFDVNETNGLTNVMIVLTTTGGVVIATNYTDAIGGYLFTNVMPGAYIIRETDPVGYVSVNDVVPPNDNLIPVTVLSGDAIVGRDFLDSYYGFQITKSWLSDSQTNTVYPDLTIGERVVYRIRVDVSNGVATNMVIQDLVPDGLDWVGDNPDTGLRFPGAGYQFVLPSSNMLFATNIAQGLSINDPDPSSASSLDNDGSGADITFTIPAVTNTPDGIGTNNYFLLDMEFVVLDDQDYNIGIIPVIRSYSNGVTGSDSFTNQTAYASAYRIAEHDVRIRKYTSPQVGDAGDAIIVTIVVSNRIQGTASAYDIQVSDLLSPLLYSHLSFTNLITPPNWTWSTNFVGGDLEYRLVSDPGVALAVGQAVTGQFQIAIATDVHPGMTWSNIASITASDTINGTPPGGIPERDKTFSTYAPLSVTNAVVVKTLWSTSETNAADSVGSDIQIGERVTYALTVTLPESTVTNLTLTDRIPAGMLYLTNRVDTSGFSGSLPTPPVVTGGDSNGAAVTVLFNGTAIVDADNNAGNNAFRVLLDVLVLDTNGNQGVSGQQTVQTNTATLTFAGNPLGPIDSGSVTTRVVEPVLYIAKNMTGSADGVVTIELIVTNRGLATAYDVAVGDILRSTEFQTATLAPTLVPPGFLMSFAGAPGDATMLVISDPAALPPTNSIEVAESLTFRFTGSLVVNPPVTVITNVAAVITNTTIRGTNDFERHEPILSATNTLSLPRFSIFKDLIQPTDRPAAIGETVRFRISITNNGPLDLNEVRLLDTYDTNYLVFSSASPVSTSNMPGFLVWTNVGFIAQGASTSVVVEFTALASTLPGVTTNAATVAVVATNGVSLPPQSDDATVPVAAPGYTLLKTVLSPTGRPAYVGETISYLISVTNSGDISLDTVRLDDTFTTNNLAFASSTPDQNLIGVGTVSWSNIGPIAVGGMAVVTARFTAVSSTLPGDTTNQVVSTVTTTNDVPVGPQTSSVPVEIGQPSYVLSKNVITPLGRPADVGEMVIYRIVVTNAGDIGLDQVRLDDGYNTNHLAYQSASIAPDISTPGSLVWSNIGPLSVGGMAVVTSRFIAINSTLPGDTTNTAISAVTTTNGISLPPQTSSVPVQVAQPSYQVTKTVASPLGRPADVGETVTYSIVVTNTGEVGLTPVRIDDGYDTNYLSYQSASITPDIAMQGSLTWSNIGPLSAGSAVIFTAQFQALRSTLPGDTTNAVVSMVMTTNGLPLPPQTSSVPVQVAQPSYQLAKMVVSPIGRPADVGEIVTYRIVVTNNGEVGLTPVRIDDGYDTNYLSYQSASISPDINAPGMLTWSNIGPLTSGAEVSFTAQFQALKSTQSGDTTNRAVSAVTTTNGMPLMPQTSSVPVQIAQPSYQLSKIMVSPLGRPADIGEMVTYRIVVTNNGEVGLTPVRVDDGFDTNYLSYQSASLIPDSVAPGSLVWSNVGPLAVSGSVSFTAQFLALKSTLPGDTTNTAVSTVTTTNGLPLLSQTSSVPAQIAQPAYLLMKTLLSPEGRPADVGETVRYRLSVSNSGEVVLFPVRVDDGYDTNYLIYASASVVPDVDVPGSLTWSNLGSVGVGGVLVVTAEFTAVRSTLPGDTTNAAVSTVTTTNGLPLPAQTSSVPVQVAQPSYVLAKTLLSPQGRPADVGEMVRYRLSVSNNGEVVLHPVRVDDGYDTNYLAYTSASAIPDVDVPGSLTWSNLGSVGVGGVLVVTAEFTAVRSTLPGDTTNAAVSTVTTTNGLPLPAQTSSVPVQVAQPSYVLVKTLLSPQGRPADVGETIRYRLSVSNSGEVVLYPVRVDDGYDTNYLSYTSATIVPDVNVPGSLTWSNLGSVGVGGVLVVTAEFTAVRSTLPGDTTNAVVSTVTTTNGLPLPAQTSSVPVQVAQPSFSLTKVIVSPLDRAANINETVVFAIVVTNTGETALHTTSLTDYYDTTHLEYLGATPAEYGATPGQVVWTNLSVMPVGGFQVITTSFRAVASTIPGDRTNLAVAITLTTNDTPVGTATAAAPYTITAPSYISAKSLLTPAAGNSDVGDTIEFVFSVTNTGDMTLSPVAAEDSFPTGYLAYVSAVPAPDSVGVGSLSWTNIGPLSPGAGVLVTARFTAVTSTLGGMATNTVVIAPVVTNGIILPPSTNFATVSIMAPAIGLVKTAGTAPDGTVYSTRSGSNVLYTYVVTNRGDTWLSSVTVTDNVLGVVGTLAAPLAPGAAGTLTAHMIITADVVNVAFVVGTPSDQNGIPLQGLRDVNASDDARVEVAYLLIEKEDIPDPVRAGQPMTYTLWIANPSPHIVTNVMVTERYPAVFQYRTAYPVPTSGNNVWSLGDMEPGKVVSIVIAGAVASTPLGLFTNVTDVQSPQIGTNRMVETTRSVAAPVPGRASLLVTKRDSVDPVTNGMTWRYTIRVENNGPAAATNVVVRETYAPMYRFISAVPTPNAGTSNVWNIGTVPADTFQEIVVTGTMATNLPPGYFLVDTVQVTASNATQASDEEVTVINDRPRVNVTKTDTPDPLLIGQTLTYTVRVVNTSGRMTATNVVVVEHYDPAFSVVSTVPAALAGSARNVWVLGNLPPGFATNIVITGLVNSSAGVSNVVFNTVEVVSPAGSRNAHATTVCVAPAEVGDKVWEDFDGNDIYTGEAPGDSAGRIIKLFNANGVLVATTYADAGGNYRFTNLWPGAYYIRFKAPTNHVFVTQHAGENGVIDSDANATGQTPAFTLAPGETNLTIDAGIIALGTIGDFVWIDQSQDGSPSDENLADQGLNNVSVSLYRITGSVTSLVATTVTTTDVLGNKGHYLFYALPFGRYLIKVTGGVPDYLTLRTTVAEYVVDLGYRSIFLSADFGFIDGPTAVELRYFRAANSAHTANSVELTWATAVEIDNLGFNVFRSSGPTGQRVRINPARIPANGTSAGARYSLTDSTANANQTYYYWLQDVARDMKRTWHGPAIRWGAMSDSYTLGAFPAQTNGGIHRISYRVMQEAGLPLASINPDNLQVLIDGKPSAVHVHADGPVMREDDYILCYVPVLTNTARCTIEIAPQPPRMRLLPVHPSFADGNVWAASVGPAQQLFLKTDPAIARYLVMDFADTPVWLFDITTATNPALLYGYSYVNATNGMSAIYLSYRPVVEPARCFAVQDCRVIEVEAIAVDR